MSAVGMVTWACQQELEKLIRQSDFGLGVPWKQLLIEAALDLDKTKMSRVEAIDAMVEHLQRCREDALRQEEEQGAP
jgi:hypothetical protein